MSVFYNVRTYEVRTMLGKTCGKLSTYSVSTCSTISECALWNSKILTMYHGLSSLG